MSKPQYMIKLCHPDDAPLLAPLIRELAIEEGSEPAEVDEIANIVSALLQAGASDFMLVTKDGEPIGCLQIAYRLSTWQAQPYAYLEDFYLVPEARKLGIGAKLLDYALQRAEGQKCDSISLDVKTSNKAAKRLYQRLGFTDSGSILMRRPLPLGETYCDTTTTLAAIEELRGGDRHVGAE
jgi:ribosomal protein S18 acetylase RimI-like enzyme